MNEPDQAISQLTSLIGLAIVRTGQRTPRTRDALGACEFRRALASRKSASVIEGRSGIHRNVIEPALSGLVRRDALSGRALLKVDTIHEP